MQDGLDGPYNAVKHFLGLLCYIPSPSWPKGPQYPPLSHWHSSSTSSHLVTSSTHSLPLADFHDLLIDDSTNLTILPFSFDAMVALSTNARADELIAFLILSGASMRVEDKGAVRHLSQVLQGH